MGSPFALQRVPPYPLPSARGRPVFTYLNSLYNTVVLKDVVNRHGLIGYSDAAIAGLLENVVYLELRSRGYTVSVGKLRDAEVDLIAERQTERRYSQVCYLLVVPETVEREFGVLERTDDNHPKLVLSLDRLQPADCGGIRRRNLVDFLVDEEG